MKKLFSLFLFFSFLFFSFNFVFAAPDLDNLGNLGGNFSGKKVEYIASKGNIVTRTTFPVVIRNIISFALGFFATILLGIILYAGFQMITSNGKVDSYKQGLKLLTTAIVAMLIVLLAYVISNFALKTVNLLTN